MMQITDSVMKLKGVGGKTAEGLKKLNIETIGDLLLHYPRGYECYQLPIRIADAGDGELVSVEAALTASPKRLTKGRFQLLIVSVSDGSDKLLLKWYNQPYLAKQLPMGTHLIFRGKISMDNGTRVMLQPEIFTRESYRPMLRSLRPVYALTAGISGKLLAKIIKQALAETDIPDPIPASRRKEYELMGLKAAFSEVHFPKAEEVTREAVGRLAFDEFFRFLLGTRMCRQANAQQENTCPMPEAAKTEAFLSALPFTLTNAQKRVNEEIAADLCGPYPMQRLLQGDVGSGKTVVAAAALMRCVENGYQGMLMAPTEVLAMQHYQAFSNWMIPLGIRVGVLTGSMTAAQARAVREALRRGDIDILIGTHSLFQERVECARLGLAVVDEQHRFGVKQRDKLMQKGNAPHLLIMSATPIPRTLAMMLYGDMAVSVLDEVPKNRKKIMTCVVDDSFRSKAYAFIAAQTALGHQCYVICPLIEESESLDACDVTGYAEKLKTALPPQVRILSLHGRMTAAEKNRIMQEFAEHKADVLVSTTVIEVGIDVPNATVIMMENAERFGLASLHQLRGRVGRGSEQSYCILMQGKASEKTKERLLVLQEAADGFAIAEEDLKLRGPGDFFGIRQSGELDFQIADLIRDAASLQKAKKMVDSLTEKESQQLCQLMVAKEALHVIY